MEWTALVLNPPLFLLGYIASLLIAVKASHMILLRIIKRTYVQALTKQAESIVLMIIRNINGINTHYSGRVSQVICDLYRQLESRKAATSTKRLSKLIDDAYKKIDAIRCPSATYEDFEKVKILVHSLRQIEDSATTFENSIRQDFDSQYFSFLRMAKNTCLKIRIIRQNHLLAKESLEQITSGLEKAG